MASPVTRRYATALYDVAVKQGALTKVSQDVELLGSTLDLNPRLARLLTNRQAPGDRKKAVLNDLFGARFDPLTMKFMRLLIDKRRPEVLQDMHVEFQHLSDAAAGIVRARVQTAIPLSREQQDRLVQQLSAMTGSSVILSTSVDSSIRGGAIVWIGDRVIDGSVAGYLSSIETRLSAAR